MALAEILSSKNIRYIRENQSIELSKTKQLTHQIELFQQEMLILEAIIHQQNDKINRLLSEIESERNNIAELEIRYNTIFYSQHNLIKKKFVDFGF
jgi:hypothetical protein